jgi:ribonucleotide monophosphatase NagD (HAD superfamily)
MGPSVFSDTPLESVTIGAGLEAISDGAFANTKLTTVTIPENIAEIGEYAKDEVLIVGDSLTSDIQGGVNAGIRTCWYNPKGAENTSNLQPNYEITDVAKVLEIVK